MPRLKDPNHMAIVEMIQIINFFTNTASSAPRLYLNSGQVWFRSGISAQYVGLENKIIEDLVTWSMTTCHVTSDQGSRDYGHCHIPQQLQTRAWGQTYHWPLQVVTSLDRMLCGSYFDTFWYFNISKFLYFHIFVFLVFLKVGRWWANAVDDCQSLARKNDFTKIWDYQRNQNPFIVGAL